MLRVPVAKIQPGMVLARPIPYPHAPFRYLLQRDREVPVDLVPKLQQLGIREVWVRCQSLEFLEEIIDEELCDRQREVYAHVRHNFEAIRDRAALDLDISHFQDSIGSLFDYLKQNQTGNILLSKLDAFDCYLMSHSTNVCYLALVTGMKLERYLIDQRPNKSPRDAKDLRDLGLGCLLHDIGKMRIDPDVLHKPGRLSEEEFRAIQQHPTFGHDMVRGQVSAAAAQVVLNHHQRYCGGGYPTRRDAATGEELPDMQGKQIPIFCRIATICDIYDAATTARVYSGAKPPVRVLHEMRTSCRRFFDPIVAEAFFEVIPPFPIGQVVALSDGSEAAVVDFNPRRPTRPKVQVLREPSGRVVRDPALHEFDLAIYEDLAIVAVDGQDITPYIDVEEPALALA